MNNSMILDSLANGTRVQRYTTLDIIAHGLMTLFLWLPPVILDILVVLALCISKSIKMPTKVTLINIVASSGVYALGLNLNIFWYIMRGLEPGRQPDSCAASIFFLMYGGNALFFSLLMYGGVMYAVIRKGAKAVGVAVLVLLAVLPWILSLPSGVAFFIPSYRFIARENSRARCSYRTDLLSVIIHIVYSWVVVGFGSCIVTAVLTIAAYCHIKKQLQDDVQISKGMYRLSGFLTVSALFLVLCQLILPTVIIFVNGERGIEDILGHYIPWCLFFLPLWTIPISMPAAFKPIRESLLKILTCNHICRRNAMRSCVYRS